MNLNLKIRNLQMVFPSGMLLMYLFIQVSAPAQKLAQFSFEGTAGTVSCIDSITGSSFNIYNHFNTPEFISGISGKALRLDGYSTWASNSSHELNSITTKMTITGWFATEAFTKENAAIISQINDNSGFALSVGPFGNVMIEFYADTKKYSIQTYQRLGKYKWNYIVATIDLDARKSRILVNGTEWANLDLNNQLKISMSPVPLMLGRHNNTIQFSGFPLTYLNGAIDEVCIYKSILTDNDIAANYTARASLLPDLAIDPTVRYAGDYLRPQYHAMPNSVWTNESYGLTFYKGKYHLFFQKNPNGPYLHFMHWGHLSSPDLVQWIEEKIALAPTSGFDNFGVWSGSTIKDGNGKPVIFYTGVDGAKAGIGTATSTEDSLIHWVKNSGNPLIPNPPEGYSAMDFRDPFLWKSGNVYYMIIGSGLQNNGGGILFTYSSSDLINWANVLPLYQNTNVFEAGIFWEMPFFFPINDKVWVLGVTPVPTQTKPAETIYWTGTWENGKFSPFNSKPFKMEFINGRMLSPSFIVDESNRITYIGIIPEDRDVNAQVNAEWRNVFSLPRVVRFLKDSLIGQVPHPNLCRLHQDTTTILHRILLPGVKNNLPEIYGNQMEMSIKIKADSGSNFAIQVFKNEDEQEYTSLIFNMSQNKIACDRRQSSLAVTPKDYLGNDYIFDPKDTINVNIFLDHSILEVFVDQLIVFSCRIYPTRIESQKTDFIVSAGKAEILELKAWKMKSMLDVSTNEVCEQVSLPNAFRHKETSNGIFSAKAGKQNFSLFPNPAQKFITIEFGHVGSLPFALNVFDTSGRQRMSRNVSQGNCTGNKLGLDISGLENGVYLMKVAYERETNSRLFIVKK